MSKKRLAIFASGSGSNAEAIAKYFEGHDNIEIALILSNKSNAYVLTRADHLGIPSFVFTRETFYQSETVKEELEKNKIDYIVLAGFMWLMPDYLIQAYSNKIFNIHPSLLPKYGGKGMYGEHVHKAVIANKEKESGITIHLVNEEYDKGEILCQEKLNVLPSDTSADLANKIHILEHKYYATTIEDFIK